MMKIMRSEASTLVLSLIFDYAIVFRNSMLTSSLYLAN
jgi:hypothetical protein